MKDVTTIAKGNRQAIVVGRGGIGLIFNGRFVERIATNGALRVSKTKHERCECSAVNDTLVCQQTVPARSMGAVHSTVRTVSAQISHDHMATAFHFLISNRGATAAEVLELGAAAVVSCRTTAKR